MNQIPQKTLKERASWLLACYYEDCECDGNNTRDWIEHFENGYKGTKDYTEEELKEELDNIQGEFFDDNGNAISTNKTLEQLVEDGEKEFDITQ